MVGLHLLIFALWSVPLTSWWNISWWARLIDAIRRWRQRHDATTTVARRPIIEPASGTGSGWRSRPKPAWVRHRVLRLKALMPDQGCRKIADTFNAMFEESSESVSKSFVAKLLKSEAREVLRLRREIKHRVPKQMSGNIIWALDLTFVPGPTGPVPILGIIDHGTRVCIAMTVLDSKRTVRILRELHRAFRCFGRPKLIRTDNESIFTSWLFRTALRLYGIRHQRTAPCAPWQNGRIERLFATFKDRLRAWGATSLLEQRDIDIFRAWYNGVRRHQHLEGLTPTEVWTKRRHRPKRWRSFNGWGGALSGFF